MLEQVAAQRQRQGGRGRGVDGDPWLTGEVAGSWAIVMLNSRGGVTRGSSGQKLLCAAAQWTLHCLLAG